MDAATMMLIGKGIGTISDFFQNSKEDKANKLYIDQLTKTGDLMKEKFTEFFDMANHFKPGGQAYKDASANATDVAFDTAGKANESLISKGVNMTSYGIGMATDSIKKDFTKSLTEDYKELSTIGSAWANAGSNLMGDYTDFMKSGYDEQYANTIGQANPFDGLIDFASSEGGSEFLSQGYNKWRNK